MAHQWFPDDVPDMFDHIAVRFSTDNGRTWTDSTPIEMPGLPARTRFPFDPTIVGLPDGKMRMYFTLMQGTDPRQSTPTIGSAISTNGINWTYERGDRFALPDKAIMNCAVASISGKYKLLAPMQPAIGAGAIGPVHRMGWSSPETKTCQPCPPPANGSDACWRRRACCVSMGHPALRVSGQPIWERMANGTSAHRWMCPGPTPE